MILVFYSNVPIPANKVINLLRLIDFIIRPWLNTNKAFFEEKDRDDEVYTE